MRFVYFTTMSSSGLSNKVNDFLESNPKIEVIDIKFTASIGNIYAAFLYHRLEP